MTPDDGACGEPPADPARRTARDSRAALRRVTPRREQDDAGFRATIAAQGGTNYDSFPQRKACDRFVTNMWTAYR